MKDDTTSEHTLEHIAQQLTSQTYEGLGWLTKTEYGEVITLLSKDYDKYIKWLHQKQREQSN